MTVTAYDKAPADQGEYRLIVTSTGHELQLGGRDGDGFCYSHGSFDCIDNLTEAEQAAVYGA